MSVDHAGTPAFPQAHAGAMTAPPGGFYMGPVPNTPAAVQNPIPMYGEDQVPMSVTMPPQAQHQYAVSPSPTAGMMQPHTAPLPGASPAGIHVNASTPIASAAGTQETTLAPSAAPGWDQSPIMGGGIAMSDVQAQDSRGVKRWRSDDEEEDSKGWGNEE